MFFIRDYIPLLLWLMGSIPCNTYENVMESVATRPTKIGVGLRFGLMYGLYRFLLFEEPDHCPSAQRSAREGLRTVAGVVMIDLFSLLVPFQGGIYKVFERAWNRTATRDSVRSWSPALKLKDCP